MTTQPTYRDLQQQLEAVLAQLQVDDIDVDEAIKLHEQGSKLIAQLEKRLAAAEHKITILKSKQS